MRPSASTPPTKSTTAAMIIGTAAFWGTEPNVMTIFSTMEDPRLDVGRWYSRAPSADTVTTMPVIISITTPIDNSTPKSRIIGTSEMRSAKNATTAVMTAATSGGPRLDTDSLIGCGSRSRTTSSSTRLCNWIAKSMPRPIRIGRPEMVTNDRLMPNRPMNENAQTTPMITDRIGKRRQRTRKISASTATITARAIAPRVSIPPWR